MSDLPDIVLVVFDTARWDRFGCYGYERPTTPTVDAMARDGLRVGTMVANGPWTLPTHGSLFTGLYPTQHGCQWQTGPKLRDRVDTTLASWLRRIGYHTICATNNGLISANTGLSNGFDRYAFRMDLERGRRRVMRRLRKVMVGGDSGGRIINRWIRDELREASGPTFLFVNYLECHWAYVPPRRLEKRVGGPRFGFIEGAKYRATLARRSGPWEAIARADDRTLDVYSTLFDGELANVDEHLDELMGILDETGHLQDGRTLLMVTSDHGEHLGEHGLADHHASLDEHLTRVPFVAYGPGLVPNAVHPGLFEQTDVFPSIARFLGYEPPLQYLTERRSSLFEPDTATEGYAFSEWRSWTDVERSRLRQRNPSYNFDGLGESLVSARDLRYKLVRSGSGKETLYDLDQDPLESTDVAAREPSVAGRLRAELDAKVDDWTRWDGDAETLTQTEQDEIEQRLTELGYI